ncbi:MAG: type II toxin-antitoxin system RelE family toxin [Nitrosopumilaceae archaeon]
MWKFEYSVTFVKQYRKLDHAIQNRVKTALAELSALDDPRLVGVFKQSMKVFAYEFGRDYRLLYAVRFEDKVIELIRVGDHKSAYGKD